jgi:hypothetical protein
LLLLAPTLLRAQTAPARFGAPSSATQVTLQVPTPPTAPPPVIEPPTPWSMQPSTLTLGTEPEPPPGATAPPRPRRPLPAFDNLSIFGGIDGSHGPEDLGISANIGSRGAIQTSFPVVEEWNLGLHVGTGVNVHQTATRFIRLFGGPGQSTQLFSTIGLFQRTDAGVNWGLSYDYYNYDGYDRFNIAQWRGLLSYNLDCNNEVGVWAAYRDRGDAVRFGGEDFGVRAVNQANLFWTHYWPSQAMTKLWGGMAQDHGQVILGQPDTGLRYHTFILGASIHVPLNDFLALYGEASFITPNDSGTVNAYLGVLFQPGGNIAQAFRSRWSPVMPLANNPNFSVDLRR